MAVDIRSKQIRPICLCSNPPQQAPSLPLTPIQLYNALTVIVVISWTFLERSSHDRTLPLTQAYQFAHCESHRVNYRAQRILFDLQKMTGNG